MKSNKTYLRTVVGAALTVIAAGFAPTSFAAHEGEEQCAGVVKAGKNDCATSRNQCHGHVMSDATPEAWIYLPKGTCDRIAGARLVTVVDPTP